MEMDTLGKKICRHRKAKGYSQEELAELVGVSRQAISKWEADLTRPSFDNLQALCVALKVKMDFFMDEWSRVPESENKGEAHAKNAVAAAAVTESVTVAEVGADRKPIPGTEMQFDCDTVLLSVGLIPENELTRTAGIEMDPRTNGAVVFENMETSANGIFACGNVVHVHDLVDFVTGESQRAGKAAADFVLNGEKSREDCIELKTNEFVSYTVPQKIRRTAQTAEIFFRVRRIFEKSGITVTDGDTVIAHFKREHMAPGEMEKITLPKVLLDKIRSGQITVSAKEEA